MLILEEKGANVVMIGLLDALAYVAVEGGREIGARGARDDLTKFLLVKGRADAMAARTGERLGMRLGGKVGARRIGVGLDGRVGLGVSMLETRTSWFWVQAA